MEIVVVTGEIAGRRVAARTVAERGYTPTGFLVEMAGRGWRWRFEGLDDEPAEMQQAWWQAHLIALVGLSLRQGRTVRVGGRSWQAEPARFTEQITEIDAAIGDSGHHVFALTEPPYDPAEPGDLVIGMGAPE